MTKWMLAAGAAALSLGVPALAGPGNGHGGGPKGQGGGAAKVEHGGGAAKVAHGGGGAPHSFDRGNPGHKAERQQVRVDRNDGGARHAERTPLHLPREVGKAQFDRKANRSSQRDAAPVERHAERVLRSDDRAAFRTQQVNRGFAQDDRRAGRGFDQSCPPGLAKKDNGCLPPGQAKKWLGAAFPAALRGQALTGPYSQWYRDDDRYMYRNDGDYIYRVTRNGGIVDGLFPFEDRDYSYYPVGMTYPTEYDSYNVPYQYRSFYPDGDDYSYRYGDGAIYQVNRSNNSIESIVALLAGDLGVGQAMPSDYGVYNVPLAYRDRYYDTPDAMYRYNDGFIYQADPKTQLITAVIDALV